jgi:flagellar hook-basal body complex protein FliE
MTVGPVGSGLHILPLQPAQPSIGAQQAAAAPGFGERVDAALDAVKQSQAQARQSATAWEQGLETDLAAVMVDQQVASLGFQLVLNVRNKALGAYRDIMNMPL